LQPLYLRNYPEFAPCMVFRMLDGSLAFSWQGNYTGVLPDRSHDPVGASPLFCWRWHLAAGAEAPVGDKWRSSNRMDLGKIREAAERVARSEGLEVFDVEWKIGKQRLLRVYLDRLPGPENPEGAGVSHLDCQRVSEQLSVILDVEDLVPGSSYILEISSPGLDRKLIKPADYERFVGRLAKIWLSEPVENKKYIEGRLAGYSEGVIKVALKNHEVSVPYDGILKANLVVEF
jgi:ribosome maturation factor RimP